MGYTSLLFTLPTSQSFVFYYTVLSCVALVVGLVLWRLAPMVIKNIIIIIIIIICVQQFFLPRDAMHSAACLGGAVDSAAVRAAWLR